MKEILDLVDELDNVVDFIPISELCKRKLRNFGFIHVFIKNT